MGKLEKIYLKRGKFAPIDEVDMAKIYKNKGIQGNLEQNGLRQITIMEKEVWAELMENYNQNLPPQTRRANLLVSDICLKNSRKKILMIGNCEIEIFGETKPCERMDKAIFGLQQSMYENWRGGAFGKAVTSATIHVGDKVRWKI